MDFYNFEFVSMTSPCSFQVYEGSYENALRCFEKIKENTFYLEKKYNFYNKESYLSKIINNRNKNKIKVDVQSAKILKKVRSLSIACNNHFDVTIGTLNKCYKENSISLVEQSLEKNIYKTGIDTWNIKNRYLEFKFDDTLIDLGGVIKEYAVDEAKDIALTFGIKSAIINYGGDIFVLGKKQNGENFKIGVKNPKNPKENLLIVSLENQALTTSASYERNVKIEEEEFSHIISKEKKQDNILSSTIISKSALESGIYSTSFMISSEIEIPKDLKIVLIDEDLQLHQNLLI